MYLELLQSTEQKAQIILAHLIHSLLAVVINLVQNVELLYETSSASHLEYFLMSHDCARSAAEPFKSTIKNTKTQQLNLGLLQTVCNEFSGTPRVQPKVHMV